MVKIPTKVWLLSGTQWDNVGAAQAYFDVFNNGAYFAPNKTETNKGSSRAPKKHGTYLQSFDSV